MQTGQTTTYDVDPDIVLDNHLWFYHTDYFEWDADQDGTADFRLGLDFNSVPIHLLISNL